MKAKCPECGHVLDLPESISGVSCICEKCGKMMMIPGNMGVIESGAPPVEPPENDDRPMDALDRIIAEKRQQYAARQAEAAAAGEDVGDPGQEQDFYGVHPDAGRSKSSKVFRNPKVKLILSVAIICLIIIFTALLYVDIHGVLGFLDPIDISDTAKDFITAVIMALVISLALLFRISLNQDFTKKK